LLYLVTSILWILSTNYLWTFEALGNIFYIVWLTLGFGFLPFIIIITLYILGQEARAVLEKDYMSIGHSKEEARKLSKKRKK
jgi:hypothetical protein